MRQSSSIARALLATVLVCTARAAPAPQVTYNSDPAAVPTAALSAANGPPSASGSLRGPQSLAGYSPNNPISDESTVIPTSEFTLAPNQAADADLGLYIDLAEAENPQPIRGSTNSPTDPGPRTYQYEVLNSDIYAPPGTDSGSVQQAMWPLALSHNRHGTPQSAGWARQQNTDQLPGATAMAGVDMRLSPNAYRELHWHRASEWAYILKGSVRLAASNDAGENFLDDLQEGDVWFFPAGYPHSIQALENGCEFLLIFDDGSFSEDGTALASELFERNPPEVLAKNLRTDVSAFDNLPDGQLYIFPGTPAPADIEQNNQTGPAGIIPPERTFSYHWSQQQPYEVPGGSVKIIDSANYPTADNFAAALVTVEPGAMRELHWHPTSDEWNYFMQGSARITVFAPPQSSQTFDFTAGDVGYIPATQSHYIENTGNETVVFLEVLQAPRFTDISVGQWLGLTPAQVVKDTLRLPDAVVANLPRVKPYILPGNANLSTTNFTEEAL